MDPHADCSFDQAVQVMMTYAAWWWALAGPAGKKRLRSRTRQLFSKAREEGETQDVTKTDSASALKI